MITSAGDCRRVSAYHPDGARAVWNGVMQRPRRNADDGRDTDRIRPHQHAEIYGDVYRIAGDGDKAQSGGDPVRLADGRTGTLRRPVITGSSGEWTLWPAAAKTDRVHSEDEPISCLLRNEEGQHFPPRGDGPSG